ncbi:hypothetical protein M0804_009199 [Polistes exclamans]|nr:hypothetical protein M0804_009199 [Polistes exclamans]
MDTVQNTVDLTPLNLGTKSQPLLNPFPTKVPHSSSSPSPSPSPSPKPSPTLTWNLTQSLNVPPERARESSHTFKHPHLNPRPHYHHLHLSTFTPVHFYQPPHSTGTATQCYNVAYCTSLEL